MLIVGVAFTLINLLYFYQDKLIWSFNIRSVGVSGISHAKYYRDVIEKGKTCLIIVGPFLLSWFRMNMMDWCKKGGT